MGTSLRRAVNDDRIMAEDMILEKKFQVEKVVDGERRSHITNHKRTHTERGSWAIGADNLLADERCGTQKTKARASIAEF